MTTPRHALRVIKKSAGIALRRSPALRVGASVRRKAASGLASGRTTLVDTVLMPAAQGSAARVMYSAVLDGHTLNLRALLPDGLPAADATLHDLRAHVLFISGTTRIRAAARLRPEADGRVSVTAAVLLGESLGGVPVTVGRWILGLELDSGAQQPVRLQLIGSGPPDYAGPTRPLDTCTHTGRRHRLGLSPSGRLRLTVAPALPRAEVLRLERGFSGLSVLFAAYGPETVASTAPPVVELVEQQRRQVRRHTAEPLPGDDSAWRVRLPLGELLDTSVRQTFALRLAPGAGGGKPLDLGRHGHDLRTPRKVLTPPRFTVRAADGTFIDVKPQYTRRGSLQLVCTPSTLGTS